MRYYALADGDPGAYGIVFPDLPGCTAMGRTMDEAVANASEALGDWIAGVEAKGGRAPEPRSFAALKADPDVETALREGSAVIDLVLIREVGRPVKASLSLDAGVLAAIDATAKRLGLTRSGLVELLARRNLATLS